MRVMFRSIQCIYSWHNIGRLWGGGCLADLSMSFPEFYTVLALHCVKTMSFCIHIVLDNKSTLLPTYINVIPQQLYHTPRHFMNYYFLVHLLDKPNKIQSCKSVKEPEFYLQTNQGLQGSCQTC